MKTLVTSGSSFEREIGYSRAVVLGDRVFLSGTTGFDYTAMSIEEDIVKQTDRCIANIEEALRSAGATLADVVRVRYMLPDADEFPKTWPSLRRAFGEAAPAATMIVCGLADPRMKIEIEVDAVIGSGSGEIERRGPDQS